MKIQNPLNLDVAVFCLSYRLSPFILGSLLPAAADLRIRGFINK